MSMIYLFRHGQASFGHDNYDKLSDLGRRQSRILGQYLFNTGFKADKVYSGFMSRQMDTANEVISVYSSNGKDMMEPILLEGFNEYDTPSILSSMLTPMIRENPSLEADLGKMYTDKGAFKRVFDVAMLRWVSGNFDNPDIESWKDLVTRVSSSLKEIMSSNGKGKTIAVFTSGGAISASLAYVLGISGEQAMMINWQVINTSISRYMYNEDRITLAGFNAISHLELACDPSLITYR